MSFMHNNSSPSDSNIVTIDLSHHPPNAKLGMLLAPGAVPTSLQRNGNNSSSSLPTSSTVTLVAGWEHGGSNQQLGPIQRSGQIRLGDRLVRINGRDVTNWTFREVMDVLKEMITATNHHRENNKKRRLKTLGFAPSGTEEWSRGVVLGGEEFNSNSLLFGLFQSQESSTSPSPHVISKRLFSFVSFIGRWRVVDEPVPSTDEVPSSTTSIPKKEQQQQQQQQQQWQQRQISEHSTDLLEEQLNKEPSMKFDESNCDDDDPIDILHNEEHENIVESGSDERQRTNQATAIATATDKEVTPSIFSSEAEAKWHAEIAEFEAKNQPMKKIVQYEIQCYLLVRDPNSPFRQSNQGNNNLNGKNAVHHSWSVWKRFSELQLLDAELRTTFGWQMDALDDGRGIAFPSSHGLESYWYRWNDMNSGVFGFLRKKSHTTMDNSDDGCNNDASNTTPCPYPESFIEKRQKELLSYWISLSRVEDIFEFSDVKSHRFSQVMASFLEVDQVLLAKRNNSQSVAPKNSLAANQQRYEQLSPSRLTGIHEDEFFSFGARKSEQWQSPLTLASPSRDISAITYDDDLILDGANNAYLSNLQSKHSPLQTRRRLLVDNVPTQFISDNISDLPLSENRSVSTKKSTQRASRRLKPAFQRQLMDS